MVGNRFLGRFRLRSKNHFAIFTNIFGLMAVHDCFFENISTSSIFFSHGKPDEFHITRGPWNRPYEDPGVLDPKLQPVAGLGPKAQEQGTGQGGWAGAGTASWH